MRFLTCSIGSLPRPARSHRQDSRGQNTGLHEQPVPPSYTLNRKCITSPSATT